MTTTFAENAGRIHTSRERIQQLMKDGEWRTLRQITDAVGGSEAGVSARLRDFRKPEYGSHTVERQYLGDGVYSYRLVQ